MNELLKKIGDNDIYQLWFKKALPYVTGAVLLTIFQVVTLTTTGKPWGVTSTFAYWGAWMYEAIGGSVETWSYFSSEKAQSAIDAGIMNHPSSWRNIGIISGALFATLMSSGFKFKKIKNKKQVVAAVLGGLMMGYGARVMLGCNIGALYSGIASMSMSGWLAGLAMLIGAIIGSKLLVKYFM